MSDPHWPFIIDLGEPMTETLSIRDRIAKHDLFLEAVAQSNLPFRQKLLARLAYRAPAVRADINEYVEDLLVAQVGEVTTKANGDLIKIIIENLPQIIEMLLTLFKLFG